MFTNLLFSSLNTIFLFYTDPGSGALIFQLIFAIFLGGLFYIRKIKDFIKNMLSSEKDKKALSESPIEITK